MHFQSNLKQSGPGIVLPLLHILLLLSVGELATDGVHDDPGATGLVLLVELFPPAQGVHARVLANVQCLRVRSITLLLALREPFDANVMDTIFDNLTWHVPVRHITELL